MAVNSNLPDDFAWLESPHSQEALDWADEQDKRSKRILESQPGYKEVFKDLQRLSEVNAPRPSFSLAADSIFLLQKSAANKRGLLKIANRGQDGSVENWRVILDLDQLAKNEGKAWEFSSEALHFPSFLFPDPRRLLVLLSDAGADVRELRELDVDTGKFVEGGFAVPQCLLSVCWLTVDHVLIGHTLHDSPKTTAGWPTTTYIWRRGTPLKEAKPVFCANTTDSFTAAFSLKFGDSPLACIARYVDFSTATFHLVSLDGVVTGIPVPQKLMGFLTVVTYPYLFVTLLENEEVEGKEYRSGSILAYDVSPDLTKRISLVYTPESDVFITEVSKGGPSTKGPAVSLTFKERGSEKHSTFYVEEGAWKLGETRKSASGSTSSVLSSDSLNNDRIVMESGLLKPGVICLESSAHSPVELYSQPAAFDASGYTVDLNVAKSKDGTEVDYYFLRPKKASNGQMPILMTAYGGFSRSFPIDYLNSLLGGISLVPWLEHGGALVVALIRGGSERGEEWHKQAMREKRQNAYDDFIAVAETLVESGFTTPQHLGAFGLSNGGLLMGVVGTQRPHLFSAFAVDVPLTDMLRFTSMAMGPLWTEEYGDPAKAEDAKFLLAYSPFHNVKVGVKYPPFLITTATDDDRVGVGHGRKFAARLKQAGAIVLYLEDRDGGHYVSNPFKNTSQLAKRMNFLIQCLM